MKEKRTDKKSDKKPDINTNGNGGKGQSEKLLSSKEQKSRKVQREITISDRNSEKKKYTIKRASSAPMTDGFTDTHRVHSFSNEQNADEKLKKKKAAAAAVMTEKDTEKERMRKKAAYIKESMQQSVVASEYADRQFRESGSTEYYNSEMYYGYDSDRTAETKEEIIDKQSEKFREKSSGSISSESSVQPPHKVISEDMAQRLKRAAYIKEMTERDISLSRIPEEEKTEEKIAQIEVTEESEQTESTEEKGFESRFTGNSHNAVFEDNFEERRSAAVKQAYEKEILKKQNKRRRGGNTDVQEGMQSDFVTAAEFAETEINALKSGNAAKVIAQPAEEILRRSLSESTNEFADDMLLVSGSVNSSDSIGGAAANAGIALAANELKRAARESYLDRADKAEEKSRERKYRYIDRKLELTKEKLKSEAADSNISKKLIKKIDDLERKKNKYKEKLAKQQKEQLQRGHQKAIYIEHNRNNPAFIPNTAKEKNRPYLFKRKKTLALAGGAVSAVMPIFIIILIVFLIAIFFSWLIPFEYVLAGSEDNKKVETEEEIYGAYIDELKNYMDVAAAQYYLTYGNYCDAYYSWDVGIPSWEEYYEKFVEPEVKAKTEEIQEKYRESFASAGKAGNYSELSRLGEAMSKEISAVVTEIIEKAREAYQEIVDKLNDMYGDPEELGLIEFFDAVKISGTAHTRTGGEYDEVYDAGQYSGRTCNGTNGFELKSLKLETDLSAEDLFTFIALSRALNVMNGKTGDEEETGTGTVTTAPSSESGTETGETGSGTGSKKKKNDVFAEITTDEINKFFEKTEFVEIEAQTHKGTCQGNCRRKLEGDWDSGFSWKYYCVDEDDPEDEPRHNVLTGKITLKTKDEMIDKIMTEYNAKGAGMSKKDCENLCKEYMKEIEKKLGNEKHYFGGDNSPLAASIYYLRLQGEGVENEGIWNVPTPIKGEEENEEEEESDETTAEKTAA